MPLMTPLEDVRPAGKPEIDQVIGAVPPPLVMVVLGYATFTSPAGNVDGPVIVSAGFTSREYVLVTVAWAWSVTVT